VKCRESSYGGITICKACEQPWKWTIYPSWGSQPDWVYCAECAAKRWLDECKQH
jgi:hypothetical protein